MYRVNCWRKVSVVPSACFRQISTAIRFTFPRPIRSASQTAGTGGHGERPDKSSAARRECVNLPSTTRRKKNYSGKVDWTVNLALG
jgi:hypothetical protein